MSVSRFEDLHVVDQEQWKMFKEGPKAPTLRCAIFDDEDLERHERSSRVILAPRPTIFERI